MDNKTELRACCGVVVLDERDRVLLMRRAGEGTWGLPGGGVEVGETSRTATPDGEATDLGWFALDQLPAPLFGPDIPVLRDAARRQDGPFID